MANYCNTTYKCVGNSKELEELYSVLEENRNRKCPRIENRLGVGWLGCIVDALGYDYKTFDNRGVVDYFELKDGVLTICQTTAWSEKSGFREVIEKAFPSVKVYYLEEESGCDVFHTNDVEGRLFPERYFLDSEDEPEYFNSIEEAVAAVSKIVGHEVPPNPQAISDALDDYSEERFMDGEDVFYSFHEITASDDSSLIWRS